jgi:hypothetical protein
MPLRTTSRPLGGWDAPAGTSSRISYLRRGPRGTSWPHASRPISGREIPIFQNVPNRHPFFQFYFFIPFFKKKSIENVEPRVPRFRLCPLAAPSKCAAPPALLPRLPKYRAPPPARFAAARRRRHKPPPSRFTSTPDRHPSPLPCHFGPSARSCSSATTSTTPSRTCPAPSPSLSRSRRRTSLAAEAELPPPVDSQRHPSLVVVGST